MSTSRPTVSTLPRRLAACAAALAAIALCASPGAARAVEGAVQYPHGADGLMAGALPPPGTYALAYGLHYGGIRKDATGDNLLAGGEKVELQVDAIALRAVHVTGLQLLGANFAMHAVLPIFNNTVTVGGASDTNTGIGDVIFAPAVLAWHRPTVHWAVAVDVFAPTGKYDKDQALGNNLGANYWSFTPLGVVSWLPGAGWELDAKLMYNVKTTNQATDYRSGDEFHVDYAVGKAITPGFRLGLSGYANVQVQEDRQAGVDVGNRARYVAVGPEVSYQAGPINLVAKWQTELASRDAFQGSRAILRLVAPL
jgi:hypothetical protein